MKIQPIRLIGVLIIVGLVLVWIFYPSTKPLPKNMITKDTLQGMFSNIRAKTKWKIEGNMLWGYYFINSTKEPLDAAAKKLEDKGYHFVEIFHNEEQKNWTLHVEKIETQTVDSLYDRNLELYQFADEMHLDTYDGMDVGPVPEGESSK